MTHLSNTEVYNRVNTQLSIVRRMDETKKYKAQLDALDRENKQALLRDIAGSDYKKRTPLGTNTRKAQSHLRRDKFVNNTGASPTISRKRVCSRSDMQ